MHSSIVEKRPAGLTFIEIALAVGVAGIVLTGVYQIASTTFSLSSEVEALQEQELRRQAFLTLVQRHLRELPPPARLTLTNEEAGNGAYVTRISIEDAPLAFALGAAAGHRRVDLLTEPEPGGTLRVRLRYLWENGEALDLPLLRGLGHCEWRAFDGRRSAWLPAWTEPLRRPHMIELLLAFSGEEPERHLLWTPRLQPSLARDDTDP